MSEPDVVLYTRVGCHLCEEAARVLIGAGLEPELVDIDRDPQLVARYDQCIPVVVIDGRERFRGRVDRRLLARLVKKRRRG